MNTKTLYASLPHLGSSADLKLRLLNIVPLNVEASKIKFHPRICIDASGIKHVLASYLFKYSLPDPVSITRPGQDWRSSGQSRTTYLLVGACILTWCHSRRD